MDALEDVELPSCRLSTAGDIFRRGANLSHSRLAATAQLPVSASTSLPGFHVLETSCDGPTHGIRISTWRRSTQVGYCLLVSNLPL